jgi:hypothetical protein
VWFLAAMMAMQQQYSPTTSFVRQSFGQIENRAE